MGTSGLAILDSKTIAPKRYVDPSVNVWGRVRLAEHISDFTTQQQGNSRALRLCPGSSRWWTSPALAVSLESSTIRRRPLQQALSASAHLFLNLARSPPWMVDRHRLINAQGRASCHWTPVHAALT